LVGGVSSCVRIPFIDFTYTIQADTPPPPISAGVIFGRVGGLNGERNSEKTIQKGIREKTKGTTCTKTEKKINSGENSTKGVNISVFRQGEVNLFLN
jgi:hypothetical protein